MNSRLTRACPRRSLRLSAAFALSAVVALGCSHDVEISYLFSTEAQLLEAPEGSFPEELARLARVTAPPERAAPASGLPREADPRPATAVLDIADVRRALAQQGLAPAPREAAGDAYATARLQLEDWLNARAARLAKLEGEDYNQWRSQRVTGWIDYAKDEPLPAIELPRELPVEFARYFEGALRWHTGQFAAARAAWLQVMALPEAERRYRSTWAAFMLGRAWAEEGGRAFGAERARCAREAERWCRQVRQLAADGFSDPLGLAAASYGWEARAALATEDYPAAIELYLRQQATGDASALESLRRTAGRAIYADAAGLQALARHDNARGVITAYLASRGRSLFSDHIRDSDSVADAAARWAAALARAGVRDEPRADRLAWVAYEGGLFALAGDWAALAPEESGMAQWIRAQLALRAGNLREGESRLRAALAAGGLDDEQRRRAAGELARACLALDRPADALQAALAGNLDPEIDYIASRVMTLAELRAFVEVRPESRMGPWLALRLARNGQVDAAAGYYPPEVQPVFRHYVDDVRVGFDAARPAGERAESFWRAAQTMHEHGEELLGSAIEAEYYPVLREKRADERTVAERTDGRLAGGVFATTAEELRRLAALPAAERNFRHYRYRAAELAWWAAALLPNDSDETARILATAGGWLKARDPEAAQPFYQALVIRCGHTALGQAAAKARWLPPAAAPAL